MSQCRVDRPAHAYGPGDIAQRPGTGHPGQRRERGIPYVPDRARRAALLRSTAARWLVVVAVLLLAVPLGLAVHGGRPDFGPRSATAVADLALAAADAGAPTQDPVAQESTAQEPPVPGEGQTTTGDDDTRPVSAGFAEQQVEAGILVDIPSVARAAAAPTAGAGSYSARSSTASPVTRWRVSASSSTEANGSYRAATMSAPTAPRPTARSPSPASPTGCTPSTSPTRSGCTKGAPTASRWTGPPSTARCSPSSRAARSPAGWLPPTAGR